VSAQGYLIKPLRFTDKRAKSGTPFRLFGTASVGGQSITGIPRLYQLRNEPKLAPCLAILAVRDGLSCRGFLAAQTKHIEIEPLKCRRINCTQHDVVDPKMLNGAGMADSCSSLIQL
jgi:hypothetical protein